MRFVFDQIKGVFNPTLVAQIAQRVRQEEGATQAALEHWSIAILAGLSQYVNRPRAMSRIFEGLNGFPYDLLKSPRQLLDETANTDAGTRQALGLIEQLFAERLSAVRAAVAERSGMSAIAAAELLKVAAPVTLAVLSQRLHQGELSMPGLANLLRTERQRLATEIDAAIAESAGIALPLAHGETVEPNTEGVRWALTMAIVATLFLGVLLFAKQCL